MDNAKSREINVIEFQPDYTGPNGNSGNTQQGGQLTKKLTGCFRFMPRYHRNLYVFDNQDFWMTLSGEKMGSLEPAIKPMKRLQRKTIGGCFHCANLAFQGFGHQYV